MLSIVVAMTPARGIGRANKLLWHLPEDLKNFKRLTMGAIMIMGRKTFDSIGRVLPGRTTLVVSRDGELKIPGATVCPSLERALECARNLNQNDEIFVVGGGEIYRQALPMCDRIYLSVVDLDVEADTYFPEFSGFKLVSSEEYAANGDYPSWSFQTWQRQT